MHAILAGATQEHLCGPGEAGALGALVHRDAVDAFLALRDRARAAGFDLRILSGFRSFDQQCSIWNRKAAGRLAVLDSQAQPLDIATLSAEQLTFAILRWSALPGASRHHWGTDLDVYDATAVPQGYEIAMIPEEVNPGGMFGPLHAWLDEEIAAGRSCGFFRPYDMDRGGVAPERWHLSYAPVAAEYLARLTPDVLRETIEPADLRLRETVLALLGEIHRRFVVNIGAPPER